MKHVFLREGTFLSSCWPSFTRKTVFDCVFPIFLCSLVKLDADEMINLGSLDLPCLFQKNSLHMLIKEQFFQHFIFAFALPKLDLPTGLVLGVLSSTEFLQTQTGTNTWLEPWKKPSSTDLVAVELWTSASALAPNVEVPFVPPRDLFLKKSTHFSLHYWS